MKTTFTSAVILFLNCFAGFGQTSPDLTPYKPDGWSDKIVISNRTDTFTDNVPLLSTDEVFLDWAILNSGAATDTLFITQLFLDGFLVTWAETPAPLPASYYSYTKDYSIGRLPTGTHTIKIVADASNVIAESNETNNEYSRTFSVSGTSLPDLIPYQPGGWSGKIVISKRPGTNIDDNQIMETDEIYIDFGVANTGVAVLSRFYTGLYVDGVLVDSSYTDPPMLTNYYSYLEDVHIGRLAPGQHTIKLVVDETGVIAESDETNNDYSKTITILPNPALRPDLIINGMTIKPDLIVKGTDVAVTADVSNLGVTAVSAMRVYFYLSKDSLFDAGDLLVCETQPQALPGHSNIILHTGFTLSDQQIPGPWYLIGFVDPLDAVKELNETNNKFARLFQVTDNSGIDNVTDNRLIRVFPNPATDVIFIDLSGYRAGINRIEIMNHLGQVVLSRKVEVMEQVISLPAGGLARGLYSVVLRSTGKTIRKALVIQ